MAHPRTFRGNPLVLGVIAWLCLHPAMAAAATDGVLARTLERGYVRCGINDLPGYAVIDANGARRGFQVDLCRALAAAVLGNADAVEFTLLYTDDRFTALVNDEVDITLSNVTWTRSRETGKGVAFTAVMDHDGQGFMAHADAGLARLADAKGKAARICVVADTTTEANLMDHIAQQGLDMQVKRYETHEAQWRAFLDHLCEVMTGDRASLFISRASRSPFPLQLTVLPDVISREPLAPVVRAGDPTWEQTARWVFWSLLVAEEKGVTQANVAEFAASSTDPEVCRLLGTDPAVAPPPGLDGAWLRRAIAAVGNYAEVHHRNLGAGSVFRMDRGLNALWKDGGLLHAPPYR